jgi:hypothetical protein
MDWLKEILNWFLSLFGGGGYNPPSGGLWKASMFFPHKLCGTNTTPPWQGNSGVDSSLDYATCHGESWEVARRLNMYKWQQAMGSDTMLFIAERLYGHDNAHLELQMFLTNMKHPGDGHQMNDKENEVVKARAYGVNRWIVDLFNDDDTSIPGNAWEDYVKQMCHCYSWATPQQVAFMVCLETNERFSVAQTKQICGWIRQYGNGKRIIVGSASAGFLRDCSGNGVELWSETDWHPFQTNASNANTFIDKCKMLKAYGPSWAGEFGDGRNPVVAKISADALAAGLAGVGSYMK